MPSLDLMRSRYRIVNTRFMTFSNRSAFQIHYGRSGETHDQLDPPAVGAGQWFRPSLQVIFKSLQLESAIYQRACGAANFQLP